MWPNARADPLPVVDFVAAAIEFEPRSTSWHSVVVSQAPYFLREQSNTLTENIWPSASLTSQVSHWRSEPRQKWPGHVCCSASLQPNVGSTLKSLKRFPVNARPTMFVQLERFRLITLVQLEIFRLIILGTS